MAAKSTRRYRQALRCLSGQQFATTTALAMLSIEEAAKDAIVKREAKRPSSPRKSIFRHEVKHEEMGEFFWGWAIFSVLSNTFDDFKSFASSSPECDSMTMELIASLSGGKDVVCSRYQDRRGVVLGKSV